MPADSDRSPLAAAAALLFLLVVVSAAIAAARVVDRPALILIGRRCDHAVLVAGALRCEDAAPRDLAGACPARPGVAEIPIRSGDAIAPRLLCGLPNPARGGPGWRRMAAADLGALGLPVQINEADAAELASLPGVGPVLAGRIVAARPLATIEALDDVKGIGPAKLAAIRGRARVTW